MKWDINLLWKHCHNLLAFSLYRLLIITTHLLSHILHKHSFFLFSLFINEHNIMLSHKLANSARSIFPSYLQPQYTLRSHRLFNANKYIKRYIYIVRSTSAATFADFFQWPALAMYISSLFASVDGHVTINNAAAT